MGQEERTACPLCDGSGPPPAYIKYKDCKEDGIIMTVEKASWDNKYQQRRKKKRSILWKLNGKDKLSQNEIHIC